MRGGKFLNQWRMAQLHAQEAPDRVRELQVWGAVFDRTNDGGILQRNFGGHTYPRLAHVGDRTGLEMIRTLQDRGVHQGIDVFMECTLRASSRTAGVAGGFGYWRKTGRFVLFRAKAVVLATGGIGQPGTSLELVGVHRRRPGHGVRAGADLIDMEFVQFHPTGMVWPPSVRGLLITEGVRGEGGVLKNKDGERFMCKYLPEIAGASSPRPRRRPSAGSPRVAAARDPTPGGRRSCSPATSSPGRSREVTEGRGSPHGGVFLDIAYLPAGGRQPQAARRCITSSRSWRTSTSPRTRWRSAPPATT